MNGQAVFSIEGRMRCEVALAQSEETQHGDDDDDQPDDIDDVVHFALSLLGASRTS
jgi:hypothetical protein